MTRFLFVSYRNQYGDCGVVEEISRDLYEEVFPTKRIGIYRRLLEMEKLLCNQPWGIRSLGIWGMPGIGKTTLAKAAFDQMSGDYEASCFIEDFDNAFRKNRLYGLLEKHFGKSLMEDSSINSSTAKSTPKRVLIALDNVCKSLDAETFLNVFDYFGPGSLIIITSRDKQVFVQCRTNQIYEVKGLNEYEAKQLLSRRASGEDWRKNSNQKTLTPWWQNHLTSVIEFASGNPLFLSLYGDMLLHEKSKEMVTVTKFLRTKKTPPCPIMKAFKSSYNKLSDNQRTMFLYIACFFRNEEVDYVMQLFEGCGLFPHVGMYVLVENCLVTISENKMQMHALIQAIGREISDEETIQLGRLSSRQWDASIIQPLLKDEETKSPLESQGVEDIEAIFLDISDLNFFVKSTAFKSMHKLKLLKIYGSNPEKHQGLGFHETLKSLPDELRLLHWEDYPLQSLPPEFDARHLVELNMPCSQLHKLWGGTKTLGMLKTIRLSHSQQLVNIDEIVKAQNIEVIDLRGCIRFQRFIGTGHLQHLRVINLSGCVEVKSIPEVAPNIEELYLSETGIKEILSSSMSLSTQDKLRCRNCGELVNLQTEIPRLYNAVNLKYVDNDGCSSLGRVSLSHQDSLKVLDLSGCSELKNIQGFPRNLKELYLSGTAIREVSSSISHLTALNVLDLTKCRKLQHLPMGMSNLTSLVKLMLTGCSGLESIQDLPRNLKELYLTGTAIEELPSSLCHLTKLVKLDAENCKRLQNLPLGMGNLKSLAMLTLSGCSDLRDIHELPRNLEILNLAETPIRRMPLSFEDLIELTALDLSHCKKLQHLQMSFFRSTVKVELFGCSELEYILGFAIPNMGLVHHIGGTNEVMLHGPPPCKVIFSLENWRRFQLLPREMTGSKFILRLTPFVTTPYRSTLPLSMASSLVSSMYAIVSLSLSSTFLSDIHIPEEVCHFPSLKTLDLGGNDFRKLPNSLKQLRNLKSLILCHCPNLKSIPELPLSLEVLNANNCMSLKDIHCSINQVPRDITFYNCFNLSPDLVSDLLEKGLASVAHMPREEHQKLIKAPVFSFSVPASVGLDSMLHLQQGSSVKIRLTSPRKNMLVGFRLSVVVSFLDNSYNDAGFGIRYLCRWENKNGLSHRLERIFDCLTLGEVARKVRKDHMFVFCDVSMHPGGSEGNDSDILDDVVVFEFLPVNGHNRLLDECCMITECGVDVISASTKKTILDSRQAATFAMDQDQERKLTENVSLDICTEVSATEQRKVGVIYKEENFEKRMWEVSKRVDIIPGGQRLKELEQILNVECNDNETHTVVVAGMAGIGKTFLAEQILQKLKKKFSRTVFFQFGSKNLKKEELDGLQRKLVKNLLKHEYPHIECASGNAFRVWKDLLLEKEVGVVFDNVSDRRQIESILCGCDWIEKGSRILITTRDMSVTEGLVNSLAYKSVFDLYVVSGMNESEGLKLFRDHTCTSLEGNFLELSRKFVDFAGGNPLALKAFGEELKGKCEGYWKARLGTLTQISNEMIRKVLGDNFENDLYEKQKDTFLDIVCFFRSQDENRVTSLLDSVDSRFAASRREVRELGNKFYIHISNGRVEMHDLVYTMGKELAESATSKYWMLSSNFSVSIDALRNKMRRDEVRGIVLDMTKMEEMPLDRHTFVGMRNLRYLKVYSSLCPGHFEDQCILNLPEVLEFPKDNIVRYFHWLNFPGQELPSDFEPKNLIDLRLPNSKITSLWGCAKVVPNLKWVDLSNSIKLRSLSSLSEAPNLEILNLEGCISLKRLPEDMKEMRNLVFLNLRGCTSLSSLPTITINSLKTLILSGCTDFHTFEVISENLEILYLNGTAIHGLPPAVGNLQRLNFLNLKDCKNLASLPDCLGNLNSLQELKLSRCLKLKILPAVVDNLRVLLLDGTSITAMPSNIGSLSFLRRLCISRNEKIRYLQFDMGQMFHLKWLELKYCKNLISLPSLPPNLLCLNAHGCTSLRTVVSPLALIMPTEQIHSVFIFSNCHELEQVSKNSIISYIQKKSELMSSDRHNQDFVFKSLIGACFPGCEVPAWFNHQTCGSVLKLELPRDWNEGRFKWIALCAIVSFKDYKDQNSSLQVQCTCEFTNASLRRESFTIGGWSKQDNEPYTVESDHVFIGYTSWANIEKRQQLSSANEVSLRFEVTNGTSAAAECEVINCGFSLVYEHEEAVNTSWEATPRMENSRLGQRSSFLQRQETQVHEGGEIAKAQKSISRAWNSIKPGEQVLKQLEEKLDIDSNDSETKTRVLGIVGMPGSGKTYLAEKLFGKLEKKLGRAVSIKFRSENSMDQKSDGLEKKLVEGLLKKDHPKVQAANQTAFRVWKDLLLEKKAVIFLDDVHDKEQVDWLLGNCDWIEKGSKIIITTRDSSITEGLANSMTNGFVFNLYKVPGMDAREGFELFRDHIGTSLEGNFMEMSRKFVSFSGGNPLALKEFGRELSGKDEDHWKARLGTLTQVSSEEIGKVLRIYFDELNKQQKDVFLDIACFFRSQNEDYVKALLDSFDPESGKHFKDLVDKFLIGVSDGRVEIHDLLFTMVKELLETSGGKYWLFPSKFAGSSTNALKNKKGKDSVRGIILDMSKMNEEPFDNKAFFHCTSLRYLKVYYSHCPRDCEAECKLNLPDEIQFPENNTVGYLYWMLFPRKELPSTFDPMNLIDLRLPYSNIISIWNCVKATPKLKWVDLSHSKKLSSISSLSNAPNLLRLNLEGCTSLEELPEVMQNMKNLVYLNLRKCTSLSSLPKITMDSLKTLILSGCSKLKKFEVISEHLETLYLNGTAIVELPPAFGSLHKLIFLSLKDCKSLVTLPDCLAYLKSLEELKLSRCLEFKKFPDVSIENLRILLLNGTSITEVPRNITGLFFLRRLCLSRNDNICNLLFDMSQLIHLKWLDLKYCKNLTSLPTLPPNLLCLNAHGCISLRTVASPLALPMPTEHIHSVFIFSNCHELEQVSKSYILSYIQKKSEMMSDDRYNQDFVFKSLIGACFPGCEVPAWFNHQTCGSVLKLELPRDWNEGRFKWIALCAIVSFKDYKDQNSSLQVQCTCEFTTASLSQESFTIGGWSKQENERYTVESDHVFIGYTSLANIEKRQQLSSANEVSLRFEVTNGTSAVVECEVINCGFSLVYESEETENTSWEATPRMESSKLGQRISFKDDGNYHSSSPTTVQRWFSWKNYNNSSF